MITTLRNLLFVVIAMGVLVLPADSLFFSLRAGTTPCSYLEGRERPKLVDLTWKAVVQGKWQSTFDEVLAFSMPRRDEALLANARWQRKMISGAAHIFGFDVYPTFYGASHYRIEKANAIASRTLKSHRAFSNHLNNVSKYYSNAINRHKNVRWFFALVDSSSYSISSHLHHLVSNHADYNYYKEYLLKMLPKSCKIIDIGIDENDDFYRYYFRTDHHWNIYGAVRAYDKIAEELGITPVQFRAPQIATDELFYGSMTRLAMDDEVTGDVVYDVNYSRSSLKVEVNGSPAPESVLNYGYKNLPYKKSEKFDGIYAKWFHNNYGLLHLINNKVDKGTLLIVGDSFGNCMERFFAESYHEVYKLDPRLSRVTLENFLDSHKVDDVLFLLHPPGTLEKAMMDFLL